MSLDRAMQRQILGDLAEKYPQLWTFEKDNRYPIEQLIPNLFYLQEHGLIDGQGSLRNLESGLSAWAKITAKGLDFLADDGGLGAILGVVTVKFDVGNIRSLLEDKIIASNLSQEQKETLRGKIGSLPGEMLREIILRFVEKGLERPDLWPILVGLISRVSGVPG